MGAPAQFTMHEVQHKANNLAGSVFLSLRNQGHEKSGLSTVYVATVCAPYSQHSWPLSTCYSCPDAHNIITKGRWNQQAAVVYIELSSMQECLKKGKNKATPHPHPLPLRQLGSSGHQSQKRLH